MFRGDKSDADMVDLSKVQHFVLTALLVLTYSAALFAMFGQVDGGTPIKKFPDIDNSFLALLGISHAAYLGYKLTPKAGS